MKVIIEHVNDRWNVSEKGILNFSRLPPIRNKSVAYMASGDGSDSTERNFLYVLLDVRVYVKKS